MRYPHQQLPGLYAAALASVILAVSGTSARAGDAATPTTIAAVENVDIAGVQVRIPVPVGLTMSVEKQPGDNTVVLFRTARGASRMTMTVSHAAITAATPALVGQSLDEMLADYQKEGIRAKVEKRSALNLGRPELSATYTSFTARKECKGYILGNVAATVAAAGKTLPFTLCFFQGGTAADEALATAWLNRLAEENSLLSPN